MDSIWLVSAIVVRNNQERSIPTFYLNGNIQGILDEEHAESIAREVVDPFGEADKVYLTVMRSDRVIDTLGTTTV